MMTLEGEGQVATAPLHRADTGDFDDIVPLATTGLPVPCELQIDELCGLSPRLAHFMVSFVECDCEERQTSAICEPCMSEMLEWDMAWCPGCRTVWSPAGEALDAVVRIRS